MFVLTAETTKPARRISYENFMYGRVLNEFFHETESEAIQIDVVGLTKF